MSGFPGQYGALATSWQEHHTPDGRAYYYNTATKVTQWTKPEEMMAPEEVRLPTMRQNMVRARANDTIASAGCTALERVYGRRRTQILVQHRNETELLGDA